MDESRTDRDEETPEGCLDENTVVAFVTGLLDETASERVEEHIDICNICRQHVSKLAEVIELPSIGQEQEVASPESITTDDKIRAGSTIDRYVVQRILGVGGMGVVLAVYDPDLNREIALKLMRPELWKAAGEKGQRRLRREAQAMAQLSHANVVRIYDVGTHGDQLFIAMELIDGVTLKDWLKESQRSFREVLETYVAAGRGLAAAHRAGLIHRDVKPANIMIGQDGRVMVTDFGLAHATYGKAGTSRITYGSVDGEPRITYGTVDSAYGSVDSEPRITQTGVVLGTPKYMSPEQYRCKGVDAKADQFAFSVALYEGLFGEWPFEGTPSRDLSGIVIKGRVKPPPKNSAVPSWVREALLRALSPEPADRFPSMDALLSALTTDPGAARRKRLRRAGQAAGLVCLVGLAVFGLTRRSQTTLCKISGEELAGVWDEETKGAVRKAFIATERPYAADTFARVEKQLDKYKEAWVSMHKENCEVTHIRKQQSNTLFDLRTQCLKRRRKELGALITLFTEQPGGEVVDQAVQAVPEQIDLEVCADAEELMAAVPLPEDPKQRAQILTLRDHLDEVRQQEKLGKYQAGLAQVTSLVKEAKQVEYAPIRAEALLLQAILESRLGKAEAAEDTLHKVARIATKNDEILAQTWIWLIWVVGYQQQRHRDALPMQSPAESAIARAGSDARLEADLANNLGNVSHVQGNYDVAQKHHESALAIRKKALGPNHPHVAKSLNNLGEAARAQGNYDVAQKHHESALAIRKKAFGPNHPHVAMSLNNLGITAHDQGDYDEAKEHYERALAIWQKALGVDHPHVATCLNVLGNVAHAQGDYDVAKEQYEHALAISQKALGPDHPEVAKSLKNLGNVALHKGDYDVAKKHHERALAIRKKAFGPNHPKVADSLNNLGAVARTQGDYGVAKEQYERALAIWQKALGPDHPTVAACLYNLGTMARVQGDCDVAKEQYEHALAIWQETLRSNHSYIAYALNGLGLCHIEKRNSRAAIPLLERALAIREGSKGDAAELAQTRFALARALWDSMRDRKQALELATQAREAYAAIGDKSKKELDEVQRWLKRRR